METSRFIRRSALPLAIAGAALVAAGCGEGRLTKGAYEQRVQADFAEVQAAFEATRDTSGSRLAERLEAAQGALRDMAESLERAEPPEVVEHENEELAEAIREYAEELEGLVAAAAAGRQPVIDRYNEELAENEAVEEIAEAAEEMKFKGFDLGRIAEE